MWDAQEEVRTGRKRQKKQRGAARSLWSEDAFSPHLLPSDRQEKGEIPLQKPLKSLLCLDGLQQRRSTVQPMPRGGWQRGRGKAGHVPVLFPSLIPGKPRPLEREGSSRSVRQCLCFSRELWPCCCRIASKKVMQQSRIAWEKPRGARVGAERRVPS